MSENLATQTVDLRVQRSRKHLMQALLGLMKEQPFQKISVQGITDRAMVNRSTFYAHFTDKYDLFASAIRQRMRGDLQDGLGEVSHPTEENLRALILITGSLMNKISDQCTPTPMVELLPLIMSEMQTGIYDIALDWAGVVDSQGAGEKTVSSVAMFTAGSIIGAVTLWGEHGQATMTIEQLADGIMPLLTDGLAPLLPAATV